MAPQHDPEAPTQINGYVKNLLGDPAKMEHVLDDLSYEQRIGLALIKLSETMDAMAVHGCTFGAHSQEVLAKKIEELRGWRSWFVGGMAGFAALMALLMFLQNFFSSGVK